MHVDCSSGVIVLVGDGIGGFVPALNSSYAVFENFAFLSRLVILIATGWTTSWRQAKA